MSPQIVEFELDTNDDAGMFDLDMDIQVELTPASPAITSKSLCTPGCTSAGGGSNCSFCC